MLAGSGSPMSLTRLPFLDFLSENFFNFRSQAADLGGLSLYHSVPGIYSVRIYEILQSCTKRGYFLHRVATGISMHLVLGKRASGSWIMMVQTDWISGMSFQTLSPGKRKIIAHTR